MGLITVVGLFIYVFGQGPPEVECEYKGLGVSYGSGKIRPLELTMSMKQDGILTFDILAGLKVNITNITVIYLGEDCQKEVTCQLNEAQEVINLEQSGVFEVTAHCPGVYQDAGTESHIYMEISYKVSGYEPTHTWVGILAFPVK